MTLPSRFDFDFAILYPPHLPSPDSHPLPFAQVKTRQMDQANICLAPTLTHSHFLGKDQAKALAERLGKQRQMSLPSVPVTFAKPIVFAQCFICQASKFTLPSLTFFMNRILNPPCPSNICLATFVCIDFHLHLPSLQVYFAQSHIVLLVLVIQGQANERWRFKDQSQIIVKKIKTRQSKGFPFLSLCFVWILTSPSICLASNISIPFAQPLTYRFHLPSLPLILQFPQPASLVYQFVCLVSKLTLPSLTILLVQYSCWPITSVCQVDLSSPLP